MLVTALAPHIGYDKAAKIAKHAHARGRRCARPPSSSASSRAEDFDRIVRPEKMVKPGDRPAG